MQSHLVSIELLIRKDCLLITHLLPKKSLLRECATPSLLSSGKGIYELRGARSRRAKTQRDSQKGLLLSTLEVSDMAAKRAGGTAVQKQTLH